MSYILAVLLLTGMLIPTAAPAAETSGAVNSPHAVRVKSGTKTIKYIHPPRKPERRRAVTPYGDFCTQCSKYGIGKRPVNIKEAVAALKYYFKTKGLMVKNVKGRGRFLKAEIVRNDKVVDRVLFDRRTGRIRSIY